MKLYWNCWFSTMATSQVFDGGCQRFDSIYPTGASKGLGFKMVLPTRNSEIRGFNPGVLAGLFHAVLLDQPLCLAVTASVIWARGSCGFLVDALCGQGIKLAWSCPVLWEFGSLGQCLNERLSKRCLFLAGLRVSTVHFPIFFLFYLSLSLCIFLSIYLSIY